MNRRKLLLVVEKLGIAQELEPIFASGSILQRDVHIPEESISGFSFLGCLNTGANIRSREQRLLAPMKSFFSSIRY
jgi:hypothetical protein